MTKLHPLQYKDLVLHEVQSDLSTGGDITTSLAVPENAFMKAKLTAREAGCLAGLEAGLYAFTLMSNVTRIIPQTEDGAMIKAGQTLAVIEGRACDILPAERTCLNIISHLSGIASATARMVAAVSGTGAKIMDTRKTLPGLRTLQKYAVRCGGGVNHRHNLAESILIKDNHLAYFNNPQKGLEKIRNKVGHTISIEIEVDTLEQLGLLLELPAGLINTVMLDNMDCQTLKQAVSMVAGRLITEASGTITDTSVREIALTGVDYISSGALTHSSRSLDIGLDIEPDSSIYIA